MLFFISIIHFYKSRTDLKLLNMDSSTCTVEILLHIFYSIHPNIKQYLIFFFFSFLLSMHVCYIAYIIYRIYIHTHTHTPILK
jgi:hypothetical protein